MREKLLKYFKKIYYLKDKIAFFPSIIALGGCAFAYVMIYIENLGASAYLQDFMPELVMNDIETGRTMLSTFIGGLISIMVFSFSMVMVLLNQASSNFSPRLLPGLISNRRHQIVLGIYIGTIIYCIFILVFLDPTGKEYQLPGFAILFSIVFVMLCLGSFIYFIHSISQEIQISNIMQKIYDAAEKQLIKDIKYEENDTKTVTDTGKWYTYKAKTSGYLQDISLKIMESVATDFDFKIIVIANKGAYCYEESDLFKVDKKLKDEEINKLYDSFTITFEELIKDNYNHAFKHLTEIAVKAMSPGINDPGTALYALDYISNLFHLRLQKKNYNIVFQEDKPIILIYLISFTDVLNTVFIALRTYCKHDTLLMKKMLTILFKLKAKCTDEHHNKTLQNEIDKLMMDANLAIENKIDLASLKAYFEEETKF